MAMSLNSSHDVLQSAFRKGHSTETALLQILNNIYTKVSPSLCCQMVLLDLSYAFDSIRHDILISRLGMIGINGSSLKWLKSYILNRSSSVKLCNISSDPVLYSMVSHKFSIIYMLMIYTSTHSSLHCNK